VLAATVAAFPLRTILGQSFKERDGNPTEAPPIQVDELGNYSKATFKNLLNSIFQLHTTSGIVEVALISVEDLPTSKGGECFALLFRGGSRAQKQDTYTMVHGALGTFQLLLVPGGADQNGAQSYLATLNRLSLADAANMKAPARVHSARPSRQPITNPTSPTTTNTTTTSTTTTAPTITAPAPASTPAFVIPVVTQPSLSPSAPAAKRKRRRKPARKRSDDLKQLT
jgi:hypothetical protein